MSFDTLAWILVVEPSLLPTHLFLDFINEGVLGTYYFYVNTSKREWFCIDPTDLDIKRYALGANFGSRAFSLLLLKNEPHFTGIADHPRVGSWIGDEIFITGDDYDDWFHENRTSMNNIGDSILEMIAVVSPYDFYRHGGERWLSFFVRESGMLTEEIRKRLLKMFREQKHLGRSEKYDDMIDLLRPR